MSRALLTDVTNSQMSCKKSSEQSEEELFAKLSKIFGKELSCLSMILNLFANFPNLLDNKMKSLEEHVQNLEIEAKQSQSYIRTLEKKIDSIEHATKEEFADLKKFNGILLTSSCSRTDFSAPLFQKNFPKVQSIDCSKEYHHYQIETNLAYLLNPSSLEEEYEMIPFKFIGTCFHSLQDTSMVKPQLFETIAFIYLYGKNGIDKFSSSQHLSGYVEVKYYRSTSGFLAFEIRTKPYWFTGKLSIFLTGPSTSNSIKNLVIEKHKHSTFRY
jgi:hypothetical protein